MISARPVLLAAAASLALAVGPAAAADSPMRPVASHGQATKATLPRLVFFMNPNGLPCQTQDRILKEMGAELTDRAQLVYFKTTEPNDIPRFQEFGVRALPLLVVTDASGRELRRATPGILAMPQVVKLLQP